MKLLKQTLRLSLVLVAASSCAEAFTVGSKPITRANGATKSLPMTVSVESKPLLVATDDIATAVDNNNVQKSYQVEQAIMPNTSSIIINNNSNNKSYVKEWYRTMQTVAAAAAVAVAGWDAHVPQLLWHAYQYSLVSHPVYTKAATSATVYAFGDVLAQRSSSSSSSGDADSDAGDFVLDVPRVARSLVAGGLGHGPLSHVYYNLSEHLFGQVLHWTAWWSTIPKIVVDQTLFGPFWNNAYLLMIGLMQGHSLQKIGNEMRTTTIPLIVSGLKLWPAVHVVTYGLMPVQYRLLWVDAVEVLWVSILATEANSSRESSTSAQDFSP